MAETVPRIGVPQIFPGVPNNLVVPHCSSLVFSASGATPTDFIFNSADRALLPTDTYQVVVALFGQDQVNGGYAVSWSSPSSGNLKITNPGDVIEVRIPNANWPNQNFMYAAGAVAFLKINNGNFQRAALGYVDQSDDCIMSIKRKPLSGVPSIPIETLFSNDPSLDKTGVCGSRDPRGFNLEIEITPTTNTINVRRDVSNVNVSPNNGPNYRVKTSSAGTLSFQSLVNDIKTWVMAIGGNYIKWNSTTGSGTYEEADLSLATAQAILQGNMPIKLIMPPDPSTGQQEIRVMFGNLLTNQSEITEAWSKEATTPVMFQYEAAAVDKLMIGGYTEVQYLKTV